jgi:hypothetical protein
VTAGANETFFGEPTGAFDEFALFVRPRLKMGDDGNWKQVTRKGIRKDKRRFAAQSRSGNTILQQVMFAESSDSPAKEAGERIGLPSSTPSREKAEFELKQLHGGSDGEVISVQLEIAELDFTRSLTYARPDASSLDPSQCLMHEFNQGVGACVFFA